MKQKIKTITEAFSMQPNSHYVGQCPGQLNYLTAEIARIEEERDNGKKVVVGYDKDDNKLFRFLYNSVNINYF